MEKRKVGRPRNNESLEQENKSLKNEIIRLKRNIKNERENACETISKQVNEITSLNKSNDILRESYNFVKNDLDRYKYLIDLARKK